MLDPPSEVGGAIAVQHQRSPPTEFTAAAGIGVCDGLREQNAPRQGETGAEGNPRAAIEASCANPTNQAACLVASDRATT
jgi:hypothetical protein